MNGIRPLIVKEFQQLKRDRRLLPIVFIAPIMQLLILGYAANLDVKDIPTLVCDQDLSPESRRLQEAFFRSGYFRMAAAVQDEREVDRWVEQGAAEAALVIRRGFGRLLASGRDPELQMILDGSSSSSAAIAASYAASIVNRFSSAASRLGAGVELRTRIWYNPELRSRNFMVPGILALLLMVMTMMLTSLAIVKEKEVGTLEQLIVTPIRPLHLILGKLLPFVLIGFVDIILVLLVAALLFAVPIKGSIILLFALSAVFLLTTLGLGLLVSTVSRTQQQAMMTAVFFLMLPMIMLSGFVFPIEAMPEPIRSFTALLPLRYFFVIVRGLFVKGVGLAELWDEALALLGYGTLILALSVIRFRKRLE